MVTRHLRIQSSLSSLVRVHAADITTAEHIYISLKCAIFPKERVYYLTCPMSTREKHEHTMFFMIQAQDICWNDLHSLKFSNITRNELLQYLNLSSHHLYFRILNTRLIQSPQSIPINDREIWNRLALHDLTEWADLAMLRV